MNQIKDCLFIRVVCLFVMGAALCATASAATMSWSASGGNRNSSGTWTGGNNWQNGGAVTWVNGSDAVFNRNNTSVQAISLAADTPITVNSITVNLTTAASTTTQINNAATSPVTLTTGNITVASGVRLNNLMIIAGSNGLTVSGGGTVALSNASNTFTGTVTVNASTLEIGQTNGALGNAANTIVLNQGILYMNLGLNLDLNRDINLTGDSTIRARDGHANAPIYTLGGVISGSKQLTYDSAVVGAGTTTVKVSGNNTYSGGTIVNMSSTATTLDVASNTAFGTQGVTVRGNSKLQMLAPVLIANNVTVESAGSMILRTTAAGGNYDLGTTGTLGSSFAGGPADVQAKIRSGVNGTAGSQVLTLSFSATTDSPAGNDALRRSDIFSLDGTGSQTFTLQLSMVDMAADGLLGWLDDDTWTEAVTGNAGAGVLAGFYAMSYDQFLANNGGAFDAATMLGAYGVDTAGDTVWAVINHGTAADFAVIPEPKGLALLMVAAGSLLFFRRRWKLSQAGRAGGLS